MLGAQKRNLHGGFCQGKPKQTTRNGFSRNTREIVDAADAVLRRERFKTKLVR